MCLSEVTSTEMVYESIPRKGYKCFVKNDGLYQGLYHGCADRYDIGVWYSSTNKSGCFPGISYGRQRTFDISKPDIIRFYPYGFHSFETIEDARKYSVRDITISPVVVEVEYKTVVARGYQQSLPCIVHYEMKLIKEVPDDSV